MRRGGEIQICVFFFSPGPGPTRPRTISLGVPRRRRHQAPYPHLPPARRNTHVAFKIARRIALKKRRHRSSMSAWHAKRMGIGLVEPISLLMRAVRMRGDEDRALTAVAALGAVASAAGWCPALKASPAYRWFDCFPAIAMRRNDADRRYRGSVVCGQHGVQCGFTTSIAAWKPCGDGTRTWPRVLGVPFTNDLAVRSLRNDEIQALCAATWTHPFRWPTSRASAGTARIALRGPRPDGPVGTTNGISTRA